MSKSTQAGFIAILGRPNVGKSTLLNYLVGKKISITAKKPQTTRHRITGICSRNDTQFIFVDTPGIHIGGKRLLNKVLNKTAQSVIHDVDVIMMLVEAGQWRAEEDNIMNLLKSADAPVVLVMNKVDRIQDKAKLLPLIEQYQSSHDFAHVVPISAQRGENIDELLVTLKNFLPDSPWLYEAEQITDRGITFQIGEIIREKIIRQLGQEVPYVTGIEIEAFEKTEKMTRISAIIWVEREGQKKIIIGKQGQQLKKIGMDARRDIEALLESKVFLQTWVKVKPDWTDKSLSLKQLGYDE